MDAVREDWRIAIGSGIAVTAPGGRDATPRARKARALIAYLATRPGHSAERAELTALLWSDRGRDQARASLRQCLFELRSEAPGLIDVFGEQVVLATPAVSTRPPPGGTVVLADLDALDPAFDGWLAGRRAAWPAVAALPVSAQNRSGRRMSALAIVAAAAIAGWFALRPLPPDPLRLLLTPLAEGDASTRFADTTRAMLVATRIRVQPASDPARADWIARATADGGGVTARVTTPGGALLWSARDAAADGPAAAAERLGDRASRALTCAAGGPPARRDAAVTALLLEFCDAMQSGVGGDFEPVVALARRLTAAAPRDAYAHGHLAASLAYAASSEPPPLAAAARAEAGREATRALALDDGTGEAWLARAMMARDRRDPTGADAAIRAGLAVEPDNPHLLEQHAQLLAATGQLDAALVEGHRALAFYPSSVGKRADVAELALRAGDRRAAVTLLDAPGVFDSNHLLARWRAKLLLWNGETAAARTAIATAGEAIDPAEAARMVARSRAIDDPAGPDAAALLAQVAATRGAPARADFRLTTLAYLGRTDAALDEALRFPVATEQFFRLNSHALLVSPRFPAVARFQGLWAYWSATGHWPDICADPALGWRCGGVKTASTSR